MESLTAVEMLEFLGTSTCPKCHKFVLIHCEQSEEHLITSSAYCSSCEIEFMVDRSFPAPFEILGGHSYSNVENIK